MKFDSVRREWLIVWPTLGSRTVGERERERERARPFRSRLRVMHGTGLTDRQTTAISAGAHKQAAVLS